MNDDLFSMSDELEELSLELARLNRAIHSARDRRYGSAAKEKRVRLPREDLQTSAWSANMPLRTRQRGP